MRIFVSDVSELYARGISGSEAVRALLRHAVRQTWDMDCPEIKKLPNGKPYFDGHPDKFLSLSHSKDHVLVALSEHDVGADIESLREIKGKPEKLFSSRMLADFGYFGGWTLRESVYKLCGKGSLRSMEFSLRGGEIVSPFAGVCCRVYEGEGFAASAACAEGDFPDKIDMVDASLFYT